MGFVQWNREEQLAVITLSRPPANALSTNVLKELDRALQEVEKDTAAKVVLLHGDGRFFAAGADIKEFTEIESGDIFSEVAREAQQLFNRIEYFPKPVIAAIHGAALGGGLELALACHIRVATENAKLGLPELTLGLIPGFGGTQRLSAAVGKAKALEMMLTGEAISGSEAEKIGLVNAVYTEETLLAKAKELAQKMTNKSPLTISMILQLVQQRREPDFEKNLEREAKLFGKAFDSEDGQEGITAFIEKRKPAFKGS
ncbi:enoyl-CoA hydratase [Halalkalibacter urbisdiaboli]|uniref:enoyl-CoA hydratase n=1 Tax=Halalkalibacter urbisdiaboli TaxID=1960589 RepID=UPI000B436251|nr:enoyl-CoA hydratase [Halalkalibacter urbisdiaboli]